MPVMCATIFAKGSVMHSFDDYFADSKNVDYDDLIKELSDTSSSFTDIFKKRKVIDAVDAKHMNVHWFADQPPGYWPLHRGKENIMKQSTIRALKCAKADGLPIVTSWVCTGGQFQIIVEQCKVQVNILLATPPPPMLPEEGPLQENIWVSGSPEAIAMIRTPYVEDWSGAGVEPPVYEATPFSNVEEIQLKGI